MPAPLVYADFHSLDDANRLKLDRAGTLADLRKHGIELAEGLALTLYMDDADDAGRTDNLIAEGIVQHNADENCWVASIDWDKIRHASDDQPPCASSAPGNSKVLHPGVKS